jgi:hypothetical protein
MLLLVHFYTLFDRLSQLKLVNISYFQLLAYVVHNKMDKRRQSKILVINPSQ